MSDLIYVTRETLELMQAELQRLKSVDRPAASRAIAEAREKGFRRICWQVLDWNEPAISFYKKYNASFDGEWINCAVDV